MNDRDTGKTPAKNEFKRNESAPDFNERLAANRCQAMIEHQLQEKFSNLDEYIKRQQVICWTIDIDSLRQMYPSPQWRRDIEAVCRNLAAVREHNVGNQMILYSPFSYVKFGDDGLYIQMTPDALKQYLIDSNKQYPTLDYNVMCKLSSVYSHEFYWKMRLHDHPRYNYSFRLTPDDINSTFRINYPNERIRAKVVIPIIEEFKKLHAMGSLDSYLSCEEIMERTGKTQKIAAWEFHIHNDSRESRHKTRLLDSLDAIQALLQKYVRNSGNDYVSKVIMYLKIESPDKILLLHDRLVKFDQSDRSDVKSSEAYVKHIINSYGIDVKASITEDKIRSSLLISDEEKTLAFGIECWNKVRIHIEESVAPVEFRHLLSKFSFFKFRKTADGSELVLLAEQEYCNALENGPYLANFVAVLRKYYGNDLRLFYQFNTNTLKI